MFSILARFIRTKLTTKNKNQNENFKVNYFIKLMNNNNISKNVKIKFIQNFIYLYEIEELLELLNIKMKSFEQVYNSKDKKAMKRYNYLSNTGMLVRIRPSKRCKKLPQFKYVAKKELKDYLQQAQY